MAMHNIKPRTGITTVKANLTSRSMTFEERQSLMDFWVQRYESAPDMRVRDSYTGHPVRSAGGQGLFIASKHEHADAQINPHDPDHPVNKAFEKRQFELKNESVAVPRQDQERIALISKIEKAAHEHWKYDTLYQESEKGAPDRGWFYNRSAKFERDQALAMEDLLTYDRQHGHPIADAQRNFDKEPVRAKEQYDWAQRNDRIMSSDERTAFMRNGYDLEQRGASDVVEFDAKASRSQPWYIDNITQRKIDSRVNFEKSLDSEYQKAQAPGVPSTAQKTDEVLSLPKEERALAKAKQQLAYIDSPTSTQQKDSQVVMAQAIQAAAQVDPAFGRSIIEASKNDRGHQAMEDHMKQVQSRLESVRSKVGNNNRSVLPLRQSDVILLRGQSEAYHVSLGANQTKETVLPEKQVEKAAVEGQKSGMSRETLAPLGQQLAARRAAQEAKREEVKPQAVEPDQARLDAALKVQGELKARAAQLESGNKETENKIDTLRASSQDKVSVSEAYKRVENRLAKQYMEGGSVLDAKRSYERSQALEKAERGEKTPVKTQERQHKVSRPSNSHSNRKMPQPGGFEQWWNGIKSRAVEFKNQAVSFVRGDDIKVPQRDYRTKKEAPAQQRTKRPAGPGSLMSQQPTSRPAATPARSQEASQPKAQLSAGQRVAALREQLSRRPAGPGSAMQQPQSRDGVKVARPQQGPNQQVQIQRPRPATGPSMDMGR